MRDELFTLDLHAASNYPDPKQKCTYDVPLHNECDDDEYMEALGASLDLAIKEADRLGRRFDGLGVDPRPEMEEHITSSRTVPLAILGC